MTERASFLDNLPAKNKDNFKVYHDPNYKPGPPKQSFGYTRKSIYVATPDAPLEQRIVNEPKPQALIKYIKSMSLTKKKCNTQPGLGSSNSKHPNDGSDGASASKRVRDSRHKH